jgi:hypothetical protein
MIKYKIGNLFEADGLVVYTLGKKPIIIPHIVNTLGVMGSGFVIPLKKRFPQVEFSYLNWAQNKFDYERNIPFELGESQIVYVAREPGVFVVNMVGQEGIISATNPHPIKYDALVRCMERVKKLVNDLGEAEIICPAFGTERAGGDPAIIKQLIDEIWGQFDVTVYALQTPHPLT